MTISVGEFIERLRNMYPADAKVEVVTPVQLGPLECWLRFGSSPDGCLGVFDLGRKSERRGNVGCS